MCAEGERDSRKSEGIFRGAKNLGRLPKWSPERFGVFVILIP